MNCVEGNFERVVTVVAIGFYLENNNYYHWDTSEPGVEKGNTFLIVRFPVSEKKIAFGCAVNLKRNWKAKKSLDDTVHIRISVKMEGLDPVESYRLTSKVSITKNKRFCMKN